MGEYATTSQTMEPQIHTRILLTCEVSYNNNVLNMVKIKRARYVLKITVNSEVQDL